MMLDVMKHVVGDEVFQPPALRTSNAAERRAVVVHGPHGEQGGQALAGEHRNDMRPERERIAHRRCSDEPDDRNDFDDNPSPGAPAGERPASAIKAQRECRTTEYGSPPCGAGSPGLDISSAQ